MISKELNLGRAGEYIAMADILLQGYQCFDTAQGVNYDLILDHPKRLIKVQIKSTSKMKTWGKNYQKTTPSYHYHIRRAGKGATRKYSKDEFDLFALVMLDTKKVSYVLNRNVATSSITLRDKNSHYHNEGSSKGRALYLQDLTLEKAINELFE
jgi:hypothetical protein